MSNNQYDEIGRIYKKRPPPPDDGSWGAVLGWMAIILIALSSCTS